MSNLVPGKRYRLTFEGTASETGALRSDTGRMLVPSPIASRAAEVEQIADPVPSWRPGDVVVVRYDPFGTPYTYVRGMSSWPGEYRRGLTDEKVNDLFRQGKATPVLQAGGVPFDPSRLPRSPSLASDEALAALRERLSAPARPGRSPFASSPYGRSR